MKEYVLNSIKVRGNAIDFNLDMCGKKDVLTYQIEGYNCDLDLNEFEKRLDGIAVTLLMWAMVNNCDIRSEYPISEKLYYHLTYQVIPQLYICNPDKSHRIKIKAPIVSSKINTKSWVGTGCSCGIDSLSTIYTYNEIKLKNYELTHLVCMKTGAHHGNKAFHTDLENRLFQAEISNVKKFSEKIGKPLVIIDSNLNHFLIRNVNPWSYEAGHIFRNIGAIMMLQNFFGKYYYSDTYDLDHFQMNIRRDTAYYVKWLLPLLSSDNLQSYSVGMGAGRFEKTRLVCQHPSSYSTLHVCLQSEDNCGHCMKCIRTMVALDILGMLDKYRESFDVDYYNEHRSEYINIVASQRNQDAFYKELYPLFTDDMKKLVK